MISKDGQLRTLVGVTAVVCTLLGVLVGIAISQMNSAHDELDRPTFYNYPVVVLSDSSNVSEIRDVLSLSTFNYRITSNLSVLQNVSGQEMILIDGGWLAHQSSEEVVHYCAQALRNGSAVAIIWGGEEFTHDVEMEAYGSISGSSSSPLSAAGIWRPAEGGSSSAGWGGNSNEYYGYSLVNEIYEWGVRAMNDQPPATLALN